MTSNSSFPITSTSKACSRCKVFYPESHYGRRRNGVRLLTCPRCLELRRKEESCAHGNRKSRCVTCGGGELCDHQRRKERCVDCYGAQVCGHMIRKDSC